LITEIQQTSDYFFLQVSNAALSKMSRLILSGGGASTKGITDFFKGRLNIPVDIPDPLSYIQLQSAGLVQEKFAGGSHRFATAIGLAQKL
jgi:Tfp pilus assembly PilM family ATPase